MPNSEKSIAEFAGFKPEEITKKEKPIITYLVMAWEAAKTMIKAELEVKATNAASSNGLPPLFLSERIRHDGCTHTVTW